MKPKMMIKLTSLFDHKVWWPLHKTIFFCSMSSASLWYIQYIITIWGTSCSWFTRKHIEFVWDISGLLYKTPYSCQNDDILSVDIEDSAN